MIAPAPRKGRIARRGRLWQTFATPKTRAPEPCR